MEIRLDGKVALVTGASKGIGRAIAKVLAENGARVMLSSRKQDALEEAAATIDGETAVFAAHAGHPEEAAACVAATVSRWGAVDILVNNAATNPYMGRTIDVDLPRYDKIFEVNLRGALAWTQEVWRASMRERRSGSIINLASVGGMTYGGAIGVYDVSKAALIHLTKHLATELGPVRVNSIAPGLVKTDMARALWEANGDRIAKAWPMKRLGEVEDIANAAFFLASDQSSWVTGHVLVVDGGAMLGGFGDAASG